MFYKLQNAKTWQNAKTLIVQSFLCLSFIWGVPSSLFGEIDHMTIRWVKGRCIGSCIAGLEKEFYKIPGVAEAHIDETGALAVLKWKPGFPFSFIPINTAMSMIGLTIMDFHIKVSGTVFNNGRSIILTSSGDNTPFILIGPVAVTSGYVEQYNLQTHPLSPELTTQLLEAEESGKTITIEGPLFEPRRYIPTLYLLVEKLALSKNKEGKNSSE